LTGVEKEVVIMDSAIVNGGSYQLFYFGARNCVLGISQTFNVR
jgi:hypothetical protein